MYVSPRHSARHLFVPTVGTPGDVRQCGEEMRMFENFTRANQMPRLVIKPWQGRAGEALRAGFGGFFVCLTAVQPVAVPHV